MQVPGRASVNGIGGPYSDAQVLAALNGRIGAEDWRFDLLANDGSFVTDLSPWVDLMSPPTLTHDSAQDVHRTLSLQVLGDAPVEPLHQLIAVRHRVAMPDGGIIQFSLGRFGMLPGQDTIYDSTTLRQLALADYGQFLVDDPFEFSYGVRQGASYVAAIQDIVFGWSGTTPIEVRVLDTGLRLPAALNWDAGTSRLQAINDLLSAVNYLPAWFDEEGVLRSAPIPDYNTVEPTFDFDTTDGSGCVLSDQGISRTPDWSKVFNAFTVTVQDPRRNEQYAQPTSYPVTTYPTSYTDQSGVQTKGGSTSPVATNLYVTYENRDPASDVSITRMGRRKRKVWQDSSLTNHSTAYAAARTAAQTAARIFAPLGMRTFSWPLSQDFDVYRFKFETTDEPMTNYRYLETAWSMTCQPGGATQHTLERLADNV